MDKKSDLMAYLKARGDAAQTGLDFSGTIGGQLGLNDHKSIHNSITVRETENTYPYSGNKKSADSKVICTYLTSRGLFSEKDRIQGLRYVKEKLTPTHERGYHRWAVPTVRKMRKSELLTLLFWKLANARADHIASLYGDTSRRNAFGWLLCKIGEPFCYVVGMFSPEQNWVSLYRRGDKA
jgi:hypothetical protein